MMGLVIWPWESPYETAVKWYADAVASVAGQITIREYQRIRDELIAGMRRAGASEDQIAAALAEYERHIAALGGTVVTNPPITAGGTASYVWWLLAFGIGVAVVANVIAKKVSL